MQPLLVGALEREAVAVGEAASVAEGELVTEGEGLSRLEWVSVPEVEDDPVRRALPVAATLAETVAVP